MTALVLALAVGLVVSGDDEGGQALRLLYDGSTDTALARLGAAAAARPEDPLAAYLETLAFAWKVEERPDSTALDKDLHRRIDRVLALADARLRRDPDDVRTLFARGAAHGLRSRLHLFRREGRPAARASVRMREDLIRVHERQPQNKDVLFGLGLYDYYVDVLPRLVKLIRFVSGMPGGDRERGLAMIEEAKYGADIHGTEVQVQLYDIYAHYEGRQDSALAEIRDLHRRYPHSPLWALRLAEHERERMGLYAESAEAARGILRSCAAGHANFAPVVEAMARLALGEALAADLRLVEAREALLAVEDGHPEASWIGPRARLLLGRLLEIEGDRVAALVHYRAAAAASDRGLRKDARSAVERAIPKHEVLATRLLVEARRLREAGRDAAAPYREAFDAWPGCDEAALRVAENDVAHGRLSEARRLLEDLVARDTVRPPWVRPWSRLLLARVHDLSGERAAAVVRYKEVWDAPLGRRELREEAARGIERAYALPAAGPSADKHSR